MFDRIKNFVKGVRYQMFPISSISEALNVALPVSPAMENAIHSWSAMFEQRDGLRLPASVAAELARLVTVECEISLSGSARADYLNSQLEPVRQALRHETEFGIAVGGLALRPYLSGGRLLVDYSRAGGFWPVSFDGAGRLSGAVFIERLTRGNKLYHRLEYHHLEAGGCVIENRAFAASALLAGSGVLGEPVPLTQVEEWAVLEPVVEIHHVDRLLIGYFKMPLANTVDPDSPLGVSAYSRAIDSIHEAQEQWGRILWEYEGTELAIHADETLFRQNERTGGRDLPHGHERLYRAVPGLEGRLDPFSPAIRDTPLFNGFNNMLKRIEFQCSLAYGTLSDPQNVDKTAEEIKASKQRSFSVVRDIQKALETALDDLIYAMDIWATLGGLAPAGAYKTAYSWDDSIINDPLQRKQMFWGYVTAGKFPMWRYLTEFEGYGEDEARQIAAEAADAAGDPYAAS